MVDSEFIDYYEVLEISPNANSGTIERMFRYLAQRYHPDNLETGNRLRFDAALAAHDTLKDPVKRAQFDIGHKNHSDFRSKLAEEVSGGLDRHVEIQTNLLSILYARRLQNIRSPGIGVLTLERLLGCPPEHLEFHIWYLKGKGWVERTENGQLAITVEGVDRANQSHKVTPRLLTNQGPSD